MAKKKKSLLHVGKVTYCHMPKEEAFRKVLEPYFSKMGYSIKVEKTETNRPE